MRRFAIQRSESDLIASYEMQDFSLTLYRSNRSPSLFNTLRNDPMSYSNEKSMTPRQLARRDAILNTVRTQLEQEGPDGLSMRKIAGIAGVSPSTLYEIYGSKEALILYAVGDSLSNLSLEEEKFHPGLDRFVRRLDSLSSFFVDTPETGAAIANLLFQSSGDSPAKEILMVNAISARRASLEEMLAQREISQSADLEFYSRALISVTWGTVLLWLKSMIPEKQVRNELLRASMNTILPIATRKSKPRILELIEECSH